jgi:hypothetical protein
MHTDPTIQCINWKYLLNISSLLTTLMAWKICINEELGEIEGEDNGSGDGEYCEWRRSRS